MYAFLHNFSDKTNYVVHFSLKHCSFMIIKVYYVYIVLIRMILKLFTQYIFFCLLEFGCGNLEQCKLFQIYTFLEQFKAMLHNLAS